MVEIGRFIYKKGLILLTIGGVITLVTLYLLFPTSNPAIKGVRTSPPLVPSLVPRPSPKPTPIPTPVATPAPQITCLNGTYINSFGNTVCRPEVSSTVPYGATARCYDGTYSFSQHRRGTCSGHGGVAQWL